MPCRLKFSWLAVPLLAVSGMPNSAAWAQSSTPSCLSIAADPDGDGFGWENNASCEVSGDTQGPPQINNLQTGAAVVLERAYWNANRDIANRNIRCTFFVYDSASDSYLQQAFAEQTRINQLAHRYLHRALPHTAPFIGIATTEAEITPGEIVGRAPVWTLENGIYLGPMPLNNTPWIERVMLDGSEDAAVRIWDGDSAHHLCQQVGPFDFAPSGSVDEELPTESPEPVLLSASAPAYTRGDEPIVDRATGNVVQLETVYWDLQADWLGQALYCQRFRWNDSQQAYSWLEDQFDNFTYYFHPPQSPPAESGIVTSVFDGVISWYNWSVAQGQLRLGPAPPANGFAIHAQVQRVTVEQGPFPSPYDLPAGASGVRSWFSSDDYYECHKLGWVDGLNQFDPFRLDVADRNLVPTGTAEPASNSDSSNAENSGGDDDGGGGGIGFTAMLALLLPGLRRLFSNRHGVK